MLGIHDRQLMLRKALYDSLTCKTYCTALKRRWHWHQTELNKQVYIVILYCNTLLVRNDVDVNEHV